MEASDTTTQEQDVPAEGESADGSKVAVGRSMEDIAELDDHQPLGAEDDHGTVTPRSAPPAGPQAGIDPHTGQATVPPAGGEGARGGDASGDGEQ